MRFSKWIGAPDNHGNLVDPIALAAYLEFNRWWKPTCRVHMGDCFNFDWLRKKASDEEKRAKPMPDFEAGIDFIKEFKPTHFLRGNHDERLWDAGRADDGKLATLACELIVDIQNALGTACIMYPYCKRKGVMKLGRDHHVIHGYNGGVHAAKNAAKVYGNVLMGHVHYIDEGGVPSLERRRGYAVGCLCQIDQTYNRAHINTLTQENGWPYGLVMANGEVVVWQAKRSGDKFILPSELREFPCAK